MRGAKPSIMSISTCFSAIFPASPKFRLRARPARAQQRRYTLLAISMTAMCLPRPQASRCPGLAGMSELQVAEAYMAVP